MTTELLAPRDRLEAAFRFVLSVCCTLTRFAVSRYHGPAAPTGTP